MYAYQKYTGMNMAMILIYQVVMSELISEKKEEILSVILAKKPSGELSEDRSSFACSRLMTLPSLSIHIISIFLHSEHCLE